MINGELILLRDKRLGDAERDFSWRVDEELSALDATFPLKISYDNYLRIYKDELRYPVPWSKRFAVETHEGTVIGNCMYYDLDTSKQQAELGIMIGDKDYWSQGYGTDVVKTLLRHLFTTTSLNRVYLHTLTWNIRAQKSFEKCGFVAAKEVHRHGYDFILMEIFKDVWESLGTPGNKDLDNPPHS